MRSRSLALLAVAALVSLPAAASAKCGWKIDSSPNPSTYNSLKFVAGSSTSDVWAVGTSQSASGATATLGLHWNGKSWTTTATQNPGVSNQLRGVADVSPTDAWAVGVQFFSSGGNQGLIEQWTGAAWKVVASPTKSGEYIYLNAVTAIAANDVWAAGGEFTASGTQAPATMHFNGTKWTIVPIPAVGAYGSTLVQIVGTSPTDAWAIGDSWTSSQHNDFVTLAEHWNGKKWVVVKTPNTTGIDNVFNSGVALAPDDVWAIGDYWNGSIFQTLTEHYNGKVWSIITSPNAGTFGNGLYAATALSTKAVWAVGQIYGSGGTAKTFGIKWNGAKWLVQKTVDVAGASNDGFNSIAAIPKSNTVWAVGATYSLNEAMPLNTMTAADACASAGVDDQFVTFPEWPATRPMRAIR
jgi:hypothetical protein